MTRVKVQAFEDGAEVANNGDVFVRDKTHADGGTWQAPSGGGGAAFPVGSIYLAVVSTNPATLLGYGTWSSIGAGRVLVGLDSGDTDFDTVEETGGAKTASHTHPAGTLGTDTTPAHDHPIGSVAVAGESAHTHGVGTLATSAHSGTAVSAHSGTAVASHGDHTHDINFAGSDATISAHSGTAVASHPDHIHRTDTFPLHTHDILNTKMAHTHIVAAGQGSHRHGMAEGTTDGSGTYMDRSNAAAATTAQTDLATLPQLDVSSGGPATTTTEQSGYSPAPSNGARDTSDTGALTLSHSVTQPNNHTLGGKTEGLVDGPLTHSVTQPDNHTVTQPAAHTMSGSTAAGSSHSHTLSGSTSVNGSHSHAVNSGSTGSGTGSIVQPYFVCYMWKRTA